MSKLVAVVLVLAVAALLFVGCSGNNNQTVFQWVMRDVSWNPSGSRIAFASFGGNGILYVYSISSSGGNLTLLTPTDNDHDLTDEGGEQPAWSPDGNDIAIAARRGGTQALFLIDAAAGAARRETQLTTDDPAIQGEDAQPKWKADSSQIVYVSTKNSPGGIYQIHVINRDGTGDTVVPNDDPNDAQWPCFTPDGTQIVYQSRIGHVGVDSELRILTIATGTSVPLADTVGNGFRDETPSVGVIAGVTKIAFSSDRNGDFDIWTMNLDGTGAVDIDQDPRSDLWPTINQDGTRIALNRDNEVWTMAVDGTDQDQVTKRFQNR